MNSTEFLTLLIPGIDRVLVDPYKQYDGKYRKIFSCVKTDKLIDVDDVLGSMGYFQQTNESVESLPMDASYYMGSSQYRALDFAKQMNIGENLLKDDLTGAFKKAGRFTKGVTYVHELTKDIYGATMFNLGFTTYTGGYKSELLLQDSHTMVSANGTQDSNILATPASLSSDSLEDLSTLIDKMKNDNGIPFVWEADKLVVPTELRFMLDVLLETDKQVGSGNNDINTIRNLNLEGIVWKHLTSATAYFITCKDPMEAGLKYVEREALNSTQEIQKLNKKIAIAYFSRWVFGFTDWRFVYGTPGA